jgi:hypothetical protein
VDEQVAHLRARTVEQAKQITDLRSAVGEQRETKQALVAAVAACEPYPRLPYKAPAKSNNPVVAVIKLSDWHVGEIINAAETEGFGRFDWAIAQKRMLYITDKFIEWVNVMRHGYQIDEVRIWREGDFISGNIHQELVVTNEWPAPVATAKSGFLLAEVTSRIAAHFKKVIVEGVDSDNHGRLNPKPQAKQKARNNWSYLAAVVAAESLKKHSNVEFRWTEGAKYLADVLGKKFLIMHGDGIKSQLSIPWYGLERERAREATRRMGTNIPFDYLSFGHFHVEGLISGNMIANGCLSGTTEFDHLCGRHAKPCQVAFLVNAKHGLFNLVPFKAE